MKNKSYNQSNSLLLNSSTVKKAIIALVSLLFILSLGAVANAKSAPDSFSGLVKKASPSVVSISTKTIIKNRYNSPYGQNDLRREFLERLFGGPMPRDIPRSGLGTGFIIDKEGYILTNNHVVEKADEIKVTLEDEREFEAKIIGRDPKTDLALIKIDGGKNLVSLALGNSDQLEVGDWVVAIGNPYRLGHTVTAGIVSAKFRDLGGPYDNFIQTDAAINQGNSGGPLMNTMGEVIGINSVIFSQTGGNIGIGFAIPINIAKALLPQLKKGKIVRGYLGILPQPISSELKAKFKLKDENGALVSFVTPGGPAENAGIERGDVIIAFDGKKIKEFKDIYKIISSTPVGKKVDVEVYRKGKKKTITVKLDAFPEDEEAMVMGSGKTGPDLGFVVEELTPETARRYRIPDSKGLIILQVQYGSPAAEAGLQNGDIILEIDQEPVENMSQFNRKIKGYKAGEAIMFLIKRGDRTIYTTLKVIE